MPDGRKGKMPPQSDVREKLDGNSSRHTLNSKPGSVQSAGGGRISPNSDKRGKQG